MGKGLKVLKGREEEGRVRDTRCEGEGGGRSMRSKNEECIEQD